MGITKELGLSEKDEYQLEAEGGIVLLTEDNVARVEAMLHYNSSYNKSGDKKACPIGDYKGSTAYWVNELEKDYNDGTLKDLVFAINRENSTRIKKESLDAISERIWNANQNLDTLKRHLTDTLDIITTICDISGDEHVNFSFATKFCHFVSFYLFDDDEERDRYSIYDNIVREALPQYMKKIRFRQLPLEKRKKASKELCRTQREDGS